MAPEKSGILTKTLAFFSTLNLRETSGFLSPLDFLHF
jgi:hypothetical protein